MLKHDPRLFAIEPILSRLIVIGFAIAIYLFLNLHNIWQEEAYYFELTVKLIIAYQILRTSLFSLILPVLGSLSGLMMMIALQKYQLILPLFSTINAWQLIMVSLIGILIITLRIIKS